MVLVNGGVVDVPWADRPAALVEAYLGGQAGGSALADVLLGSAEPGGRLAGEHPVRRARSCPPTRTSRATRGRWSTARRSTWATASTTPTTSPRGSRSATAWAYTTFSYGAVEVTGSGTDLVVAVDVTNTGTRAGSEVVQVYVRDVESTLPRPAKELAGFARLHLEPGQTARAEVALGRRSFAVWDVAAGDWLVEAGEYEILVGASSTDVQRPRHGPRRLRRRHHAGAGARRAGGHGRGVRRPPGQAHPGARRAAPVHPHLDRDRPARPAGPAGASWPPCAGGCSGSSRSQRHRQHGRHGRGGAGQPAPARLRDDVPRDELRGSSTGSSPTLNADVRGIIRPRRPTGSDPARADDQRG